MHQLIDQQNRAVLNEGRVRGIGHAFCRRDGDTFITAYPISPCKDYLSDQIFSEWTGKPFQAYGLSAHKQNLFDTHAYLATKVCKAGAKAEAKYEGYDDDVKRLDDNWPNVQTLLNWFEDAFGVEHSTFIPIASNAYVVKLPLFWTRGTYLISLYTLLLRAALFYGGKADVMTFLETVQSEDRYLLNDVLPKIRRMLAGERPEQDLNALKDVHNTGIKGFSFPPAKQVAA